jgi:hypothetical protein
MWCVAETRLVRRHRLLMGGTGSTVDLVVGVPYVRERPVDDGGVSCDTASVHDELDTIEYAGDVKLDWGYLMI